MNLLVHLEPHGGTDFLVTRHKASKNCFKGRKCVLGAPSGPNRLHQSWGQRLSRPQHPQAQAQPEQNAQPSKSMPDRNVWTAQNFIEVGAEPAPETILRGSSEGTDSPSIHQVTVQALAFHLDGQSIVQPIISAISHGQRGCRVVGFDFVCL